MGIATDGFGTLFKNIQGAESQPGVLWLTPLEGVTSLTSGASAMSQDETVTNKVNLIDIQFANGVKTYWEATGVFPPGWDTGTVTATFYWTATSALTDPVVLGCQGRIYSSGDAIDQAFGTAIEVTSANTGTDKENIATTGPITLAGTAAASKRVQFRVYRLGSGADTLAVTIKLLAVAITYSKA